MPDFIRYVLALAVLASGFYGASRFRVTGLPEEKVPLREEQPLTIAPPPLPAPWPAAMHQLPPAALIDTERELTAKPPAGEQEVRALPSIAESDQQDRSRSGSEGAATSSSQEVGRDEPDAAPASPPEQAPAELATAGPPPADSAGPPLPDLAVTPGERFLLTEEKQEDTVPIGEVPAAKAEDNSSSADPDDPASAVPAGVARKTSPPEVEEEPRRHWIVDGDTLPKLAARYLGDRSRYEEIFRKNLAVLTDPRLLPVGVEIEIPPHSSEALEKGLPTGSAASSPTEEQAQEGIATSPPAEEPSPVRRGSDLAPIPPQALPRREG